MPGRLDKYPGREILSLARTANLAIEELVSLLADDPQVGENKAAQLAVLLENLTAILVARIERND